MSGNTFGTIFKVTTYGESHGVSLGVVIDGVPAGIPISPERIQKALDRRKPGKKTDSGTNHAVTARQESDAMTILSGVFEGLSTGTPIAMNIPNTSQHSSDYGNLATTFRPGHADYTYDQKYGIRDYRGGGRSSGRETAARVAAGEVARMVLEAVFPAEKPVVTAYTAEACGIKAEKRDLSAIEQNMMRAPDNEAAEKMQEVVAALAKDGDSAGGIIECVVTGIPAGLGEPVFDKLDAELAKAMLSIGAVKGIEFGAGFESARMNGSTWNDVMRCNPDGSKPQFLTNHAGGILGGISNGNSIVFRVAVKPVPSIFKVQQTVDKDGNNVDLQIKGRHDVCLCPRIVPVIEAMTAIVLADMALRQKNARP